MHKFLDTAELFCEMSMYYLYASRPNFSYFTTVIVINFEADYLLNCWTYRNTGSRWFIFFDFQELLILSKIDQTSGSRDRKRQKS